MAPLSFFVAAYSFLVPPSLHHTHIAHTSVLLMAHKKTAFGMAKSKKPKFYAVAVGKKPGIYSTWTECENQTKGFSGARFKSFPTRREADEFILMNSSKTVSKAIDSEIQSKKRRRMSTPPSHWISVDVHFDGGSRGNPGVAGAGATVVVSTPGSDASKRIDTRKYLGTKVTNNEAEYQGLVSGLLESKEAVVMHLRHRAGWGVRLSVMGDSDLIIQQMSGTYSVKSKGLEVLYSKAKAIVEDIESLAPCEVSFRHIYRKDNREADRLANEAMDSQKSWKTEMMGAGDDVRTNGESSTRIVLEDV